ncbi:hypothetical protein ACHAWO_007971 [Cyclotella atomus]|uniref:Uncharacterized protein n=1 Tax=Cyclotella atomus TaxID=382360 RepID=A0ABD3MZK1_9STRA
MADDGKESSPLARLEERLTARVVLLESDGLELKRRCELLEQKNVELESSLQESRRKTQYLETLVRNQHYQYPHKVLSPAELVTGPNAVDEDEASETFLFNLQLRGITTDLKHGAKIKGNRIMLGQSEHSAVLPLQLHCSQNCMPHWKEFAEALYEYQDTIQYFTNVDESFCPFLSICNIEVTDPMLAALEKALEHTHFHRMEFFNIRTVGVNDLDLQYVNFAINCIQANPAFTV